MNAFTEVSAVVTHPHYTGLGFAKKLIAHTCHQIFLQNKMPYLHVAENNVGAINLYEKLGFKTRRKMSFWNLIKTA
ncbi:FR47-like protein [compost metagenome]